MGLCDWFDGVVGDVVFGCDVWWCGMVVEVFGICGEVVFCWCVYVILDVVVLFFVVLWNCVWRYCIVFCVVFVCV